MKGASVFLVLATAAVFGLTGCSDTTDPGVAPQSSAADQGEVIALAKGPVVHSASGNCGIFVGGKSLTFAFTAKKYADGSCSGEYQIYVHYQEPDWGKWHGKVVSLEVYDGNKAVIGGIETHSGFPGYYDAFVVVDNGEGGNATGDTWTSTVYWDESLTAAEAVWAMSPDDVVDAIVAQQASWGNILTPADVLTTIQHGNIQVQ